MTKHGPSTDPHLSAYSCQRSFWMSPLLECLLNNMQFTNRLTMKCSSTSILIVVLQISIGSPLLQRIFVMHSGSPRIATIARVVQIGRPQGPRLRGGKGGRWGGFRHLEIWRLRKVKRRRKRSITQGPYSWMNTRQIDIFFKISNPQQCWLTHFVRFVTVIFFLN